MIKDAMIHLQDVVRPAIFEIQGRQFTNKQLSEITPAAPQALHVNTLTAVVDYVQKLASETDKKLAIQICNSREVRVITYLDKSARWALMVAEPEKTEGFRWGHYMNQEAFIITAKQYFAWDEKLEELLRIVSSIVEENSVESVDDGRSQRVTTRSGVEVGEQKLPIFHELRPENWWIDFEPMPTTCFLRYQKGPAVSLMKVQRSGDEMARRIKMRDWLADQLKIIAATIPIIM